MMKTTTRRVLALFNVTSSYYEYYNFMFVVILICLYYLIGGRGFPDYTNYITIVHNGGYLFSPNEYLAEWVSRYFFRHGVWFFGDAETVVDAFVVLVQFIYVAMVFMLCRHDAERQRGWFFFTMVLGPLLITTALRAAPAYLLVAYIGAVGMRPGIKLLLLGLLALAFHDSALVMVAVYGVACFCNFVLNPKTDVLYKIAMALSLFALAFSGFFAEIIFNVVSHMDLGIRSIYFQELPQTSLIKKLFVLIILMAAWTAIYSHVVSHRTKMFLSFAMLMTALSFTMSEVVGVRFSLYVLGTAVLAKGSFLIPSDEGNKYKQLDVVLAVGYFFIIFLDILRNAR